MRGRSIYTMLLSLCVVFLGVAVPAGLSDADPPGVHAFFDLMTLSGSPFPTDRFTVPDSAQNTDLRVALLTPDDCSARPSDCDDVAILNELDGFNVQPRLSIPFSGPIDVNTVTSETVFVLGPDGQIGINQVVWDPETNTLHVESDELLAQHTRYVLIVMRGLRDAAGEPLEASGHFQAFRHSERRYDDPAITRYRTALREGLADAEAAGVDLNHVAVASVFTTMSVTPILEKIREQIRAAEPPEPAEFMLGNPDRTVRTVFPLGPITAMNVNLQVSLVPGAPLVPGTGAFGTRLAQLRIIPGAVGTVAFGSYHSPVYLNEERYIPQVATRTGMPAVQGVEEIFFNLFLPAPTAERPRPENGWPVAIFLSGCCDDTKNGSPMAIAATLANRGIASMSINAAGQGYGPLGTLTVRLGTPSVTFPVGGRGADVDGDLALSLGEGVSTRRPGPRSILLARDSRRQTIADLMQLVRVIEVGVDVEDDEVVDLDASRIYYSGWSWGGNMGPSFAAVEPNVRASALNVLGGIGGEWVRLSVGNRSTVGELLEGREPSGINSNGITSLGGAVVSGPHFNENQPLRDDAGLQIRLADGVSETVTAPVVNTVPGAIDIQEVLERMQWVGMPVDPVAFAPYLQKTPLAGRPATPVLVQFARGDQTVSNPATTALLRAGALADQATFYRTDLAVAAYGAGTNDSTFGVTKNGHAFLTRQNSPVRLCIARGAQEQIATFFGSDGAMVIDPDDVALVPNPCPPERAPVFEAPILGPLPEDLGFIP